MALLASCWLIVESFIIPNGFLKWFYLSFYIHPLFLVFCQIFLWLKTLKKWLLILFFPLTFAFRLSIFVFEFLKRVAIFLFSCNQQTKFDVFYDALEPEITQILLHDCEIVVSCNETRVESGVFEVGNVWKVDSNLDTYEEKKQNSYIRDSWLNEYLYSDHYTNSVLKHDVDDDVCESLFSNESIVSSPAEIQPESNSNASFRFSFTDQSVCFESHEEINHQQFEDSEISSANSCDSQEGSVSPISNLDFNNTSSTTDEFHTLSAADNDILVDHDYSPAFCGSDCPIIRIKGDIDPFHQKYTSRMRFFNLLYHERLHGMNAILNEHSTDLPMQITLWGKMERKRLLTNLECDLEMIYVAQSCLFWEALYYQYQKIEVLTYSDNSQNKVFLNNNVSGKFQQLQILLERFVEEQRCESQRFSNNNIHKRLSFQGLLQVPDATGFVFMEEENKIIKGEGATKVLEAIDNCIKAFWLYIKTDEKKSLWKYKGIWRTNPPVEDPQDLELLYDVTKTLHKKGMMLKDLQGKNKCWLRSRVKPLQTEDEKRNLLFAMIDLNLVQRLLKMSLISTSHLKWSQEKLNNLDIKEGKVFRGRIGHLFPMS